MRRLGTEAVREAACRASFRPDAALESAESWHGSQVQCQFNTRPMLFDAASHMAKISRSSTLYPGDVV